MASESAIKEFDTKIDTLKVSLGRKISTLNKTQPIKCSDHIQEQVSASSSSLSS